jgi:hypothetical protein
MKYLKNFESYDFGRFEDEEDENPTNLIIKMRMKMSMKKFLGEDDDFANEIEDEDEVDEYDEDGEEIDEEDENKMNHKKMGDEIVEKKK